MSGAVGKNGRVVTEPVWGGHHEPNQIKLILPGNSCWGGRNPPSEHVHPDMIHERQNPSSLPAKNPTGFRLLHAIAPKLARISAIPRGSAPVHWSSKGPNARAGGPNPPEPQEDAPRENLERLLFQVKPRVAPAPGQAWSRSCSR